MSKAIAFGSKVRNVISLLTSDPSHCVGHYKNVHCLSEMAPQPKSAFPALSLIKIFDMKELH